MMHCYHHFRIALHMIWQDSTDWLTALTSITEVVTRMRKIKLCLGHYNWLKFWHWEVILWMRVWLAVVSCRFFRSQSFEIFLNQSIPHICSFTLLQTDECEREVGLSIPSICTPIRGRMTAWLPSSTTSVQDVETELLSFIKNGMSSDSYVTGKVVKVAYVGPRTEFPSSQVSILLQHGALHLNESYASCDFILNALKQPSETPSVSSWPTFMPSDSPSMTGQPSLMPSSQPSFVPSQAPSASWQPSSNPSQFPSTSTPPSSKPSAHPSVSDWPTSQPSSEPTSYPSMNPSMSAVPSSKVSILCLQYL